jgi:heme oxygenase
VTTTPHQPDGWPEDDDFVPTDELIRRHGARPMSSVHELAASEDPFESDEEYAEFLADLYASRRADIA